MSIICGALRWLTDHEKREREELEKTVVSLNDEKKNINSSNTDWLSSQAEEIEINKKLQQLKLEIDKITKFDEKINKIKSKKKELNKSKWLDKVDKSEKPDELKEEDIISKENEDNEFLLDDNLDLDSDDEQNDDIDKFEGTKV